MDDEWQLMDRPLEELEIIIPEHLQPPTFSALVEWDSPPEVRNWLIDNAIQVQVKAIRLSRQRQYDREHKTRITYLFSDPNHAMLFKLAWC